MSDRAGSPDWPRTEGPTTANKRGGIVHRACSRHITILRPAGIHGKNSEIDFRDIDGARTRSARGGDSHVALGKLSRAAARDADCFETAGRSRRYAGAR